MKVGRDPVSGENSLPSLQLASASPYCLSSEHKLREISGVSFSFHYINPIGLDPYTYDFI